MSLSLSPVAVKGLTHTPPRSPTSNSEEGRISFDTKVYCLSKHFVIDSLQSLAPLKFEDDVEEQRSWDGVSQMAEKEVASIITNSDDHDWKPGEAILGALYQHPKLDTMS